MTRSPNAERRYTPAEGREALRTGRLPLDKVKIPRQKMNATERAFMLQVLEPWKLNSQKKTEVPYVTALGWLDEFGFERVTLKLADDCRYTPDFYCLVARGDRQEVHFFEVKGFWRDDARVKIKVAADRFPHFRFTAATWEKRREWHFEHFAASPESAARDAV